MRRGAEIARAIKQFQADTNPMLPYNASATLSGNVTTVTFGSNIEGDMIIDTDLVSNMDDGNYGGPTRRPAPTASQ